MTAGNERLWPFLFSKLRRADEARISDEEVATIGAVPTELLRAGLLEHTSHEVDRYPDCGEWCFPTSDWESQQARGLVGVSCRTHHRRWDGAAWVDERRVQPLRCLASAVFPALRDFNGLEQLDKALPDPFVPVGILRRRGLTLPVVWMRDAVRGGDLSLLGLRRCLAGDGLIVLVPRQPTWSFPPNERIAVIELVDDPHGGLGLERALDLLDPDFRERAATDPSLDLDFVRLTFATRPGDRHVLLVNGHDFAGFRKSDVRFLRLLLLAAARKRGEDDGWVDKVRLRDGVDKDRALGELRDELVRGAVPGIERRELRALVKGKRGRGLIRLAVPPESITLDPSIAQLAFVSPTTTTRRDGTEGHATVWQAESLRTAALLLRDCRRCGAPSDTNGSRVAR